MQDLTQAPITDPAPLYRCRDELYATDMLIAAVNALDLFTWLDAQPSTIAGIAQHFAFASRPVDVMTTLFVAMELLRRDGDVLRLTARAREHLVSSSPWFLGPYFPKVADRPIAGDLLNVLRTGQPANFASRANEQDWHRAMETEAFAAEFTAAMDRRGLLLAQALAKNLDLHGQHRLLDIAGGSGIYACSLAAHFPGLTGTVLDKSPVDRIAAKAIATRGFSDRIDVIASDMLAAPLPAGYDVHLFSNVLHDWDEDVVMQLLRASANALPSGGRIIIHDAFLNDDKTGPLSIASYSVLLMHVTQGRCYSVSEMTRWLQQVGFEAPCTVDSAIGRSGIVASRSNAQ
jgi:3-hydroxy-5-methyl-1-naphthoate 3-O-methyltransferase